MSNRSSKVRKVIEDIRYTKEHYLGKANNYKTILALGGVYHEQITGMIHVIDFAGESGVDLMGVLEVRENDVPRFREMALRAMEYVDNDRSFRSELTKKAVLLNELDSDEVRLLVKGYYVAVCASILCQYAFVR